MSFTAIEILTCRKTTHAKPAASEMKKAAPLLSERHYRPADFFFGGFGNTPATVGTPLPRTIGKTSTGKAGTGMLLAYLPSQSISNTQHFRILPPAQRQAVFAKNLWHHRLACSARPLRLTLPRATWI